MNMWWKILAFISMLALFSCVGQCGSNSSENSFTKHEQSVVKEVPRDLPKDTLNPQQHRGMDLLKKGRVPSYISSSDVNLDSLKKGNEKFFKDAFVESVCGDKLHQKIRKLSGGNWMIWGDGKNDICAIVPLNDDFTKSGEGFVFDGNGILRVAMEYENNVLDGEMVIYDRNQKMVAKVPYSDGKENGVGFGFDPSGKVMLKSEYKNGYQDGLEQGFYENGDLASEATYKKGKIVGNKTRYWKKTGAILALIPYKNGVENGIAQRFSKDGQVVEEIPYVNGKINGVYRTYCQMSANKSQLTYKNGNPVGQKLCISSDGKITKRGLESMSCCDEEKILAELKNYIEENSSRIESSVKTTPQPKGYKVHKGIFHNRVTPKY